MDLVGQLFGECGTWEISALSQETACVSKGVVTVLRADQAPAGSDVGACYRGRNGTLLKRLAYM